MKKLKLKPIKRNKTDYNYYLYLLLISLIIICIFGVFDYIIHALDEEYAVPSYYYRNKIIFGTLIGFGVLLFTKKFSLRSRMFLFSGIVALLMQIRYFLEGYSLEFVFEFLIMHFVLLLPVAWVVLKYMNKYNY